MAKRAKIYGYIRWIAPDAVNFLVYSVVIFLTFLFSNLSGIQNLFKYTDIKNSTLEAITNYLDRFLPENLAANMATFIFWAFIGLIVYLVIFFIANFTTDLKDDLSVDKYVYPQGVDKYGRLKNFIFQNTERIFGIFVLIFYLNLIFDHFLPRWTYTYNQAVAEWPIDKELSVKILLTFLAEFIFLHVFIILMRLILMRKRVLGL